MSSDSGDLLAADCHREFLGEIFNSGQVLAGKYKLVSIVGTGGMGTVYRAQHLFLNKDVALKVLDSRKVSDEQLVRRFRQEAKAAFSLSHPNLIQVHDFGLLEHGQPYLAMDLIEGVTLADYIREHGPLTLFDAAPLFAQVCFALSYAHDQSIVHRDIKPSNIMLVNGLPLGSEGSVIVVDFGIAKLARAEGDDVQALTRTGEIFGSPLYMSPEQCAGDPVDHRSDIYSLGCVLFEALTGTPPYLGSNALRTMMLHQTEPAPQLKEASLGKEFPDSVERIVSKMLKKEPFERYQSLGVVAHDLSKACKDSGVIITPNAPAKSKIPRKAEKVVAMTRRKFSALMALTVVSTAVITELVSWALAGRPGAADLAGSAPVAGRSGSDLVQHTLPGAGKQETLPSATFDAEQQKIKRQQSALARFTPQPSRKGMLGGKKGTYIYFPDCTCGRLTNRYQVRTGDELCKPVSIEARGRVFWPEDTPLTLELDGRTEPAMVGPALLKKIDGQAINELVVKCLAIGECIEPKEQEPSQPDSTAQVLTTASEWPDLKSVSLSSMPASKRAFASLNNFKKLNRLDLSLVQCDPAELARQPVLKRLKRLSLSYIQDPHGQLPSLDAVIRSLSGSSMLEHLVLGHNPVSPDSLRALSKCPHLIYLQLQGDHINDQLVDATVQIKSLEGIQLTGAGLSPGQIRTLSRCPRLRGINISRPLDSSYKALKMLDPRIRIFSN